MSDASAGQETIYRDIFEASQDPIMVHDAETGEILQANPAAGALLGLECEDLIGLKVGDFSPPQYTTEEANDLIRKAAREGEVQVEWSVSGPDGDMHWVDVSLRRATIGGTERVIAYIRDVTDRKAREQEMIERTEQLQTLVQNIPVVVFTLDPEGIFTHSSGQGLESLGAEPGDFDGMSVYDAYGEYDDIIDAVDRALAGEEIRVTQEIDDLVFETWYKPVFDDSGDLTQVVGVARDITDLKRREERVEQLNNATRDLLYARDRTEVATIVTDIAERIIDRPISAMWAYDPDDDELDPVGATPDALSFLGVETVEQLPSIGSGTREKAIFDDGETTEIENYQQLENPSSPNASLGTLLCLPLEEYGMLNVGSDQVDPFGDTERFLLEILASTATAALDRVEREAELEARQTELKRSNEALQQFAYIASHDLQEPLRMVSSYVDLLDSEYGDELDEEAREYMEFAVDGATRMKSMIDGLLSYSRVDTQASSFETVDANELVETTLQELSLFLDEEGASVEYESLPQLRADGTQLGQVFQNLVKNAATHGDASTIEITATESSDGVEFTVADDGVGIPPHQREKIFDIFEQGEVATSGSGIGLAVCERIVHRHDGDIWVESDDDGTRFTFTIPQHGDHA